MSKDIDNIAHITEWDMRGYNEGDSPWYFGEGYYYTDETGEYIGPYLTIEDADLALESYVAWMNRKKEEEK